MNRFPITVLTDSLKRWQNAYSIRQIKMNRGLVFGRDQYTHSILFPSCRFRPSRPIPFPRHPYVTRRRSTPRPRFYYSWPPSPPWKCSKSNRSSECRQSQLKIAHQLIYAHRDTQNAQDNAHRQGRNPGQITIKSPGASMQQFTTIAPTRNCFHTSFTTFASLNFEPNIS